MANMKKLKYKERFGKAQRTNKRSKLIINFDFLG